ncbi:MAG: clostripain-related cysteine peptidase [Candidatus Thermoplasmatota archaeon]
MLLVGNARAQDPVPWTLAVYYNGDNDLERYWDEYSLPALLNIPASDDFEIVAVLDRMSTQTIELMEIEGGTVTVVNTYPEMNFGDGATFAWFLTEVTTLYPSENLVVTASDHGYAWRYFSNDQTSGDKITMPELQASLVNAGVHIDVLSFDCCNMAAIEVVYQVSLTGMVDNMVASEETIPMNGFPYDLMFAPLASNAARTPDQVAVDMVAGWAAYYDPLNWAQTVALSAVDVASIGAQASVFDAWCARMHTDLALYKKNYKYALSSAYCAWATSEHVDMADLGEWLLADAKIKDTTLRTLTSAMIVAIDDAVLAFDNGPGAAACHGLTLWWGVGGDWDMYADAYTEVAWAIDMGWWAFLNDYN